MGRGGEVGEETTVVRSPPRTDADDVRLSSLYYDEKHPASFASVKRLQRYAGTSARAVTEWLRSQPTYTIHRQARKHFPTNFYRAFGPNQLWECDLMITQNIAEFNKPFTCLLTVIDVFDRFAFVEPLRSKSGPEVTRGFAAILERAGTRRPAWLQADSGTEFSNASFKRLLDREGIRFRVTRGVPKAACVERFNRSLRDRLWRTFYFRGSYDFRDILQNVVAAYNASVHSATGYPPDAVRPHHRFSIWANKYLRGMQNVSSPSLKAGQFVRLAINRAANPFARGYTQSFTEEIFKITYVQTKHRSGLLPRPLYHVCDLSGEPILGGYYREELTPVTRFDPKTSTYKIEKIVARRKNRRGEVEGLVKFLGYPESMNQWLPLHTIQQG